MGSGMGWDVDGHACMRVRARAYSQMLSIRYAHLDCFCFRYEHLKICLRDIALPPSGSTVDALFHRIQKRYGQNILATLGSR